MAILLSRRQQKNGPLRTVRYNYGARREKYLVPPCSVAYGLFRMMPNVLHHHTTEKKTSSALRHISAAAEYRRGKTNP